MPITDRVYDRSCLPPKRVHTITTVRMKQNSKTRLTMYKAGYLLRQLRIPCCGMGGCSFPWLDTTQRAKIMDRKRPVLQMVIFDKCRRNVSVQPACLRTEWNNTVQTLHYSVVQPEIHSVWVYFQSVSQAVCSQARFQCDSLWTPLFLHSQWTLESSKLS